jgi:DsbC/DsbD-like thiol-disulfide interchange protein
MRYLMLAACALAIPSAAFSAGPFIHVDMVTSTTSPRPGSTVLVGFRMVPRAGWHGYWSNAGESGIAPAVRWTAPPRVHFGPLLHPAPTLLRSMGLASYVHDGPHVLISRMTVDRSIAAGTSLPVTADLSWAACSDKLCVPEHATLSLELRAGDGKPSADAALLERSLARLPAAAPHGTFEVRDGTLLLQLPRELRLNAAQTRFFPDANGYYDPVRARPAGGGPIEIASPLTGQPPASISGVVSDGSNSYRLSFRREKASADHAAAADPPEKAAAGAPAHAPRASPAPRQAEAIRQPPSPPPSSPPRDRRGLVALASISLALVMLALLRRR